jgi:hypothetical protein
MPRTLTTALNLVKPARLDVEGWDVPVNVNWDRVDSYLSNWAVAPAHVDLVTGLATSLDFVVAGGPFGKIPQAIVNQYGQDFPGSAQIQTAAGTTGTAAAGAMTYVWVNLDGSIGSAAGNYGTDERFAPLARIVADSTKIVAIIDDLRRPQFLGGGVSRYVTDFSTSSLFSGGAVTPATAATALYPPSGPVRQVFRVDCSGGPVSFTLPAWSVAAQSAELIFKKVDNTANAMEFTASGADTIDDGTTKSVVTPYSVLHLYCRAHGGGGSPGWDVL